MQLHPAGFLSPVSKRLLLFYVHAEHSQPYKEHPVDKHNSYLQKKNTTKIGSRKEKEKILCLFILAQVTNESRNQGGFQQKNIHSAKQMRSGVSASVKGLMRNWNRLPLPSLLRIERTQQQVTWHASGQL